MTTQIVSNTKYNTNVKSNENSYSIIFNINLNKRYVIEKYSKNNKKPDFVQQKVRDISLDKSGWSNKVIERIKEIILNKQYRISSEMFVPAFTTTNEVANITKADLPDIIGSRDKHMAMAKQILDTNNENRVQDVYINISSRFMNMNDEQLAFTILLLSDLAKEAKELWVSPILMMKQIMGAIFYFTPESGNVILSKRSFMYKEQGYAQMIEIANKYMEHMNSLISRKVNIPNYIEPVEVTPTA